MKAIRTNSFGKGERATWNDMLGNDFPNVLRNANLGDLKKYPEYPLAKSGDKQAADKLIQISFSKKTLQDISSVIAGQNVCLIPVLAMESSGKNQIPLAIASYLWKNLSLPIETRILQHDKVYRTNQGADFRLVFTPVFKGPVEVGKNYFLIDDTLTMGGTLAALHGYIKNRGGNVLGAFVMTAHEGALHLPIKQEILNKIDAKHGQELRDFWKEFSGYDIDRLTQAEAGHFLKANSVESIKERMKNAYNEHINCT